VFIGVGGIDDRGGIATIMDIMLRFGRLGLLARPEEQAAK